MSRKPLISKVCPTCGIDKPRSDYYKKGSGISYRCKPCSLKDNQLHAKKYFGKYRDYQNEWRRIKYNTDPAFRAKNPGFHRRSGVSQHTPSWANRAELERIYATRPEGMEVDHIIPLNGLIDGRKVCGLHVPWNLQYLTPSENKKKRNKISEIDII